MNNVPQTVAPSPRPGLLTLTHVIYGLHSLSVLIGVTTAATVVGVFVFGWPSILAVILNYVKRSEVRGTWLDSHFRWQIRTFWFALLWYALAGLLILSLVGILLGWAVLAAAGIWVIYRVIKGWLALNERRTIEFK
ncbi:MAG TPA: hypothetical protein VFP70_04050 [Burkholderiales bacterium]|nr:hypothetical protein [Burkholderiales bacterium]